MLVAFGLFCLTNGDPPKRITIVLYPLVVWFNPMGAKDLFHHAVKNALLKEQWLITADPLKIKIDGVRLEIDLAAEKVLAAEKAGRKIAVEIKSFLNASVITDFHAALGQFLNYRLALQMTESERVLYLAVPVETFTSFFQERFVQESVTLYQIRLLVYDSESERIIEWKD
ncbi:XisH family protein [Leptolyngbya sp. NIES-2104]|uniref:XisH family protein n=1 Tax=Leptolyngbya sp. NIES-2104 TaxID=1552121 RepID=UPI0006EC7F71|nr:fdxN element excision controlling factor protein [Leptolyngbya sp. NIES-2104]